MQPVDQVATPGTVRLVYGSNQTQYENLPALVFPEGSVLTIWQPSDEDRQAIAEGKNLRLWIWTFGQLLQPVLLEIDQDGPGALETT